MWTVTVSDIDGIAMEYVTASAYMAESRYDMHCEDGYFMVAMEYTPVGLYA